MRDEMKQEPLPCPFCGSKADIHEEGANHIVTCAGPGCYISMRVISECRRLAVAKWNTRPDSKPYKFKTYWDFARSFGNEFPGREGTFNAAREREE